MQFVLSFDQAKTPRFFENLNQCKMQNAQCKMFLKKLEIARLRMPISAMFSITSVSTVREWTSGGQAPDKQWTKVLTIRFDAYGRLR